MIEVHKGVEAGRAPLPLAAAVLEGASSPAGQPWGWEAPTTHLREQHHSPLLHSAYLSNSFSGKKQTLKGW